MKLLANFIWNKSGVKKAMEEKTTKVIESGGSSKYSKKRNNKQAKVI
jgi:hypothetical protein